MPDTIVLGLFFDPKTIVFGIRFLWRLLRTFLCKERFLTSFPYCLSRTPHEFWKITVPLSSVS